MSPWQSSYQSDKLRDDAVRTGSRMLIQAIWRTYPGLRKYREVGND